MDIDATFAPVAKELIDVTFPTGIRLPAQQRRLRPGHW